jgi:hypothetical protein
MSLNIAFQCSLAWHFVSARQCGIFCCIYPILQICNGPFSSMFYLNQYRLNLSNHYLYIKGWRGFKILHFEGVHTYEIHYIPHRQLEWCRYPYDI